MRPTTDGRGNGAFALQHIPAGSYLGDYEGDMLDEASYWARYPSGVVCTPCIVQVIAQTAQAVTQQMSPVDDTQASRTGIYAIVFTKNSHFTCLYSLYYGF